MPRRERIDFDGAIHHVMNRGVDRQPVFFADADRVEFGYRLAAIHRDFGVETLAYCLMDNHYHLLLHTPNGGLSAAMQQLGGLFTQHTNDRVGRDGPLFRGRFHSILVTTDAYLAWVARYIHRNPLAIAGVDAPDRHRWSSYRAYLGLRRCPPFLNTQLVLSLFGEDRDRLAAATDDDASCEPTRQSFNADDIALMTRSVLAMADTDGDARVLERSLLVLLASSFADSPELSNGLLAALSFPSPTAHRMALHRARKRFDRDPALRRVLGDVLAELGQTA